MRILIVGAGAIGSFLGARLALAGHAVTLVGRPSLAEAVRAGGLTLVEPAGTRLASGIAVATSIAEALAGGAAPDLTLITVKAYDTTNVLAELATSPLAADGTPFLTLQNGVGNEEALAGTFGPGRVLSGAIDTPVTVPAPGQVQVHRAAYRIGLAAVEKPAGRPRSAGPPATDPSAAGSESLARAAQALTEAGYAVSLFDSYRGLKWTKLLMNLLANASCAILDWTPAQVMADPVMAPLEARAWQEALAVMAGLGVRPVTLGGYPFPLLLPVARRLPARWLARALRGFVSGGRGSKMPSLHLALAGDRPSEVSWLNGAVVRYGRQLGIPVPVNGVYTEVLSALAHGKAAWQDFRGCPDRLVAKLAG